MTKFYITTSIAYTNAKPHIGFALELFQADVIARLHRLFGYDVKFLTGTDEHGLKIFRKAAESGQSPQEFVNEISSQYQKLANINYVSKSDFIRTTDQVRHWPAAQKLWNKLADQKLLEKRKYSGLYCIGCERYIKESELNANGECPDHLKKPETLASANYFFKLSQFTTPILDKIRSNELKILPRERRQELMQLLENGLEDISFSRDKAQMPWGIPVPGDPEQVMYVWCDALTNYISALGYGNDSDDFKQYWPADTHMIGKDILRFHAAIWPAMLMAADLALPKNILVHGFIQSGGQRMSKTIGNIIDPFEIIEKYGQSAFRIILLKEIPAFKDGNLTIERIGDIYQSELANKLGNLVSRVTAMANKYFAGQIPPQKLEKLIQIAIPEIKLWEINQVNYGRTDLLIAQIWQMVEVTNQFVDEQKPWELAKENNQTKLGQVLLNMLESIRLIALLLEPIDPVVSKTILSAIDQESLSSHHEISQNPEKYPALLSWGGFNPEVTIKTVQPIFPRIDEQ